MDDSEDFDLKRAIALSLGQNDPAIGGSSSTEIIDLDSDDEPSSFNRPISPPAPRFHGSNHATAPLTILRSEDGPSDNLQSLGIPGLDRKRMETERLARKRKASPSSHTRNAIADLALETKRVKGWCEPPYLRGAVKKTFLSGCPRKGDDIKLEEILQKDDLLLAVLSSFQWDYSWILSKISRKTNLTLVVQAKNEFEKRGIRHQLSRIENLRFCFPSMEGQVNCMHSKVMLLVYEKYLRIAVPTSNLVSYDWGETGEMENMVFIIDLPRRADGARRRLEELTFFGQELSHFLSLSGLEKGIVDSLLSFDFEATERYGFVYTTGGSQFGEDMTRNGHCGLARAIQTLDLATSDLIEVDFVTSSVGSLNMDFLSRLYAACQGVSAQHKRKQTKSRSKKALAAQDADQNATGPQEIATRFRIYFPTEETVKMSKAGWAGTICMQEHYYINEKFPRDMMRDCVSTRPRTLMHNKVIFVRSRTGSGWAYIGSANCSESAWGSRVLEDIATKQMKINCRNWESGIIFPLKLDATANPELVDNDSTMPDLQRFEPTVPIPMRYPGTRYGSKNPWYFMSNN